MKARNPVLVAKAIDLRNAGLSLRATAKRLGLSRPTIEVWSRKGLIPKRPHNEAMALASKNGNMKGASVWTEFSRAKQRANMLRRISEDPMNHPNRRLAGNRSRMSFPERVVFDELSAAGIEFQHNPKIDRFYPDFVIGKRIFEIDGSRWHNKEADAKRDSVLVALGFSVERISAKDAVRNPRIILDRLQVL